MTSDPNPNELYIFLRALLAYTASMVSNQKKVVFSLRVYSTGRRGVIREGV